VEGDLLEMPSGGVTRKGLEKNIVIGVAFIDAWLRDNAVGHFALDGCVEDSATAEISRSQVWQWITHGTRDAVAQNNQQLFFGRFLLLLTFSVLLAKHEIANESSFHCSVSLNRLEEDNRPVTRAMVLELTDSLTQRYSQEARDAFKQVVTSQNPPQFITTHLNESSVFLGKHFFGAAMSPGAKQVARL
jgi:hypothetical protein